MQQMLLAIDIGNSATKFAVYEGENQTAFDSTPTVRRPPGGEIFFPPEFPAKFSSVVISSVVPELNEPFRRAARRAGAGEPIFLDASFDYGLKIRYRPPSSLGVDRLVAAFAAGEKYGAPVIVCDFGTATTIDAVSSRREFLGGAIAPGVGTLAASLERKTALLPPVMLAPPASVIGRSTVECIQSGIFYGYLGLTKEILRRMRAELGEKPRVVATGGFGPLIAGAVSAIEIVDERLMLDGLRLAYEKIAGRSR